MTVSSSFQEHGPQNEVSKEEVTSLSGLEVIECWPVRNSPNLRLHVNNYQYIYSLCTSVTIDSNVAPPSQGFDKTIACLFTAPTETGN